MVPELLQHHGGFLTLRSQSGGKELEGIKGD